MDGATRWRRATRDEDAGATRDGARTARRAGDDADGRRERAKGRAGARARRGAGEAKGRGEGTTTRDGTATRGTRRRSAEGRRGRGVERGFDAWEHLTATGGTMDPMEEGHEDRGGWVGVAVRRGKRRVRGDAGAGGGAGRGDSKREAARF